MRSAVSVMYVGCTIVSRLPKKDKGDITQSAVYKMIHGIDQPKAKPVILHAEGQCDLYIIIFYFINIRKFHKCASALSVSRQLNK